MPDDLSSYFGPGPGGALNPDAGANLAKARAMSQILRMGLMAGAVGVGTRAAVGVPDFIRRQLVQPPSVPKRQSYIKIPVPIVKESSVFDNAGAKLSEMGGLLADQGKNKFKDWGVLRTALMTHRPDGNLGNMPWAAAGALGAVGGGLYGGWKLTDKLMDRSRTSEQEDELESAKRRYENAMLMSYSKVASEGGAEETFTGLDKLYSMAKEAGLGDAAKDVANNPWFGGYASALGVGTLASALTTGTLAYNAARGDAEDRALTEAVRRRQEMLAASNPLPIEAVPQPYYVTPKDRDKVRKQLAALPTPAGYAKKASVGQAASQTLGRLKARQAAMWRMQQMQMGNNVDGGGGSKGGGDGKQAPQLPTMAGAWSRLASQPG